MMEIQQIASVNFGFSFKFSVFIIVAFILIMQIL